MAEQEVVHRIEAEEEEVTDLTIEVLLLLLGETLLIRVVTKQRESLIKDGEQEDQCNNVLIHILQEEGMKRHHFGDQEATLMIDGPTKRIEDHITAIVVSHRKDDEDQRR